MGVAPGLWIKAEIVRGGSVGVCLLLEPVSDSSSRQRLCIERDCGIRTLGELFVAQGDHHRIDAHGPLRGDAGGSERDCRQQNRDRGEVRDHSALRHIESCISLLSQSSNDIETM